jgi:hypothetical protein
MAIHPRKQKTTAPGAASANSHYVVCIANDGYTASLEKRKIYQTLPDAGAAAHSLLRVIDESGEDYLYPAKWFVTFSVSPTMAKALALAV